MTSDHAPQPYYQDDWVTIYHGDCRQILTWQSADVLLTDPPYGIGYSPAMGQFRDVLIEGDDSTELRDFVLDAWAGKPALVFGSWKARKPRGVRHVILWEKGPHVGMGNLDIPWRPNVEEIYVIGTGFNGHRGSSVLRHNAPSPNFTPPERRFHPTEKPLPLIHDLLAKCPSGEVADPFCGAGSTLIAAKNLGRRAIGVEIEERYCEIAANRCRQEVLPLESAS